MIQCTQSYRRNQREQKNAPPSPQKKKPIRRLKGGFLAGFMTSETAKYVRLVLPKAEITQRL